MLCICVIDWLNMMLLELVGMMFDVLVSLLLVLVMFWLMLFVLLSELCVLEIVFVDVCRFGVLRFL